MTTIFNGKEFAQEKELELHEKIAVLKKQGITPKLVSIVIGDVDGAMKYQEMKKKVGERLGIKIEIKSLNEKLSVIEIMQLIKKLNTDDTVHGIMIQLPLPSNFTKQNREALINTIESKKDVDGMKETSDFTAPVVQAVMETLSFSSPDRPVSHDQPQVAVVGANGFEGKKMVYELEQMGFDVKGLDKEDDLQNNLQDCEIVISCTGVVGLIKSDMLKDEIVAIDVGAPKGDFDFENVSQKASFITPVPGGIGPVTIACLMENIVEAAEY